jgi:hypothetical protein
MNITLSPLEYTHAAQAGFLRQAANICKGRADAYGFSGDGYNEHITGAIGEFVVSLALGLPWRGPGSLRAPDVGQLQVRATQRPNGSLILHDGDNDADPFVLVTGSFPTFTVRGYIWGRQGKRPQFWNDQIKRPAYFVPQSALRPLSDLIPTLEYVK